MNKKSIKYLFSTIIALVFAGQLFAQTDSTEFVKYSPAYKFNDGIFLNFAQVKNNTPIPKVSILTEMDYRDINFFDNLLKQETITVYDDFGVPKQIAVNSIWGYARNGGLYVNWNGEFNRMPVVGQICHFVANKTVYDVRNYDRYYNPYSYNMRQQATPSVELRQYLLDFSTGDVYDYSQLGLENILMRDGELYDEYKQLKIKKQRDLKFFYLRKFNERNPIYFPKEK